MSIVVRRAEIADARNVAEVHVATWRHAYRGLVPDAHLDAMSVDKRESKWREILSANDCEVWLADDQIAGTVAGWISFGKCRDADKDPAAGELMALYVSPGYWSRGVGRTLWLKARSRFLELGFTEVTLWCLADNQRADRFYRAAGFVPTDTTIQAKFGDTILEEVRYEQVLKSAGDSIG